MAGGDEDDLVRRFEAVAAVIAVEGAALDVHVARVDRDYVGDQRDRAETLTSGSFGADNSSTVPSPQAVSRTPSAASEPSDDAAVALSAGVMSTWCVMSAGRVHHGQSHVTMSMRSLRCRARTMPRSCHGCIWHDEVSFVLDKRRLAIA